MLKKIIIVLILILFMPCCFSKELGNKINPDEFPIGEDVLPEFEKNSDFIISGSVEKNIDITGK